MTHGDPERSPGPINWAHPGHTAYPHGEAHDTEDGWQTEMAIADVRLPGVYEVTETGKGLTAKYMAEKARAAGQDNPTQQAQDQSYDRGTLLEPGDDPEPYLNSDNERIIVSEDRWAGERYLDSRRHIIVGEDHAEYDPGTVLDANDETITGKGNDPGEPFILATQDSYTIASGESESESESESDSESDSDSQDEESQGQEQGQEQGEGEGEGEDEADQSAQTQPEGADSLSARPRELTVKAYCNDETWAELDGLRDREKPFDVAIGEFVIDGMGILNLQRSRTGDLHAANHVTINLKQFREVTVQVPFGPQTRGGGMAATGPGDMRGWVDKNSNNVHDTTGEWKSEFGVVNAPANAVLVAGGDDVQAAIDSVSGTGGWNATYGGGPAYVHLQPGQTYQPDGTWQVKPGVILDADGATVTKPSTGDIIHVHPRAGVRNLKIDQRGQQWRGAMLKLDTRYGRYWGAGNPMAAQNVSLLGDTADTGISDQIGIHAHSSASDPHGLHGLQFSGYIEGLNESIRLEASASNGGWTNGLDFRVQIESPQVAVNHVANNGGVVNANRFVAAINPLQGTSEWAWHEGTQTRFNTFYGDADPTGFTNSTLWHIPGDADGQSAYVDTTGQVTTDNIDNNSPGVTARKPNALVQASNLGSWYSGPSI